VETRADRTRWRKEEFVPLAGHMMGSRTKVELEYNMLPAMYFVVFIIGSLSLVHGIPVDSI
jgi:hypothetical protein